MAYDIGVHGLARRYFVQALGMAQASGDRALGGKVLALMSHQATHLGEFTEAADLARAAALGGSGHATPRARAMYAAMEARALAGLGDTAGCRRALADAERAFEHTESADDPHWIQYFDTAELNDEIAHCAAGLGETSIALEHAELAFELSGAKYPRSRTFCRLALASAYVNSRTRSMLDVEAACSLALTALPMVGRIKSKRVRTYLRRFESDLDPYRGTRAVREYNGHRAAELRGR